jgi:hypothetical protein
MDFLLDALGEIAAEIFSAVAHLVFVAKLSVVFALKTRSCAIGLCGC